MVKSVIIIFVITIYTAFSIPLDLKVDGAVFRYDSLSNILEFYYSFSDNSLRYIYEDGKYTAELDFKINILNNDKIIDSTFWPINLQTK